METPCSSLYALCFEHLLQHCQMEIFTGCLRATPLYQTGAPRTYVKFPRKSYFVECSFGWLVALATNLLFEYIKYCFSVTAKQHRSISLL